MSGSKPRHWLVVLGMILLVIVSGVIVVSGISLAVHGGGMDEVIEMAEKAGWGLVALVGAVVLIFVGGCIAIVCGDAVDRWRDRRPPDEEKDGEATSTGRSGSTDVFFLTFIGICWIALLVIFGEHDLIDLAQVAAAVAVLVAVCRFCDKVSARRRKWREHGRRGRWWTQK